MTIDETDTHGQYFQHNEAIVQKETNFNWKFQDAWAEIILNKKNVLDP